MAIKKSAKKALRQSLKRRQRNLLRKEKIKRISKEIRKLLSQQKISEAKELLPSLYQSLDKAAKAGTIKKNTAARKKSRMAKLLAKFEQQTTPGKV